MNNVVLDTNVILDNPEVLLSKEINIILPYTVISELDKLKRNPELKPSIQSAFKIIKSLQKDNKITFVDIPNEHTTNDEKIIAVAKENNATLWTNDIGASVIAKGLGVSTKDFVSDESTTGYLGYRQIFPDYTKISNLVGINELPLEEAEYYFDTKLILNEYIYYDVPNSVDKFSIWRLKSDSKVYLVKTTMKPYNSAGFRLVPQDVVQSCALDAIFSVDTALTIIEGRVGTGKSLLAICAALARVIGQHQYKCYEKIYVTRAPIPINKALQIGYLPGTSSEKLSPWLAGVKSNLKFLFENSKADKEQQRAEEIFNDNFEALNLESVQGINFHKSILIVDEYQLLSADMLKQITTRAADGSKIILVGDPEGQVYGLNRGIEGYKKFRPYLKGCPDLIYVKLENIYRSRLTSFVEEVFN